MRERAPLADRFWPKVAQGDPDECWLWMGARRREGPPQYGIGFIVVGPKDGPGRLDYAPRVAWKLTFGAIPEGLCVCHACDTPRCCNPSHLWLGTKGDNNRDRTAKGRGKDQWGENNSFAKFSSEQVKQVREMWEAGKWTQFQIAARFGMSQPHVSRIVRGEGRARD